MKKLISFILSLCIIALSVLTTVSAALSETYFKKINSIAPGINSVYYNGEDASGALQKVYLLDYTPGEDVIPIVSFGTSLLSRKTLSSLMKTENAVAGINGDFFSFYTGIPMGAVICDGVILCSDADRCALGILPDGTTIVGYPQISFNFTYKKPIAPPEQTDEIVDGDVGEPETVLEPETVEAEISESVLSEENEPSSDGVLEEVTPPSDETREEDLYEIIEFTSHYNKYPTVYNFYLTNSDYSDSTASDFDCLEIILKPDGEIKIGSDVKFIVEAVYTDTRDTAIPQDRMVLTCPNTHKTTKLLSDIKEGDTLDLSIRASEGWEMVETAIGAGDIIVKDSSFVSECVDEDHEKWKNSRTAVGIREDGSIFFASVDSKNSSSGMNLSALAYFMISEGAVTALNLDGGGSTTVAVSFPGDGKIRVVNTPSEGTPRAISNAVLFVDTSDTEKVKRVSFNTENSFVIAESEVQIIPDFYNGNGVISSDFSASYNGTNTDAYFESDVYKSASGSYIDEITATFSIDGENVTVKTALNVTDTVDDISLGRKAAVVSTGDKLDLNIRAEKFSIPVIMPLEAFVYSCMNLDTLQVYDAQTSDDYLFDNEYFSLSKEGEITVNSAPAFSTVELQVAYKETAETLKLYFGKKDIVIEDFELDADKRIKDTAFFTSSEGYRSEAGIKAFGGTVAFADDVLLDTPPKYFTLWVKGECREKLYVCIESDNKSYMLPYDKLTDYSQISGWTEYYATVPEEIKGEIIVINLVTAKKSIELTVDNFGASFGYTLPIFADVDGVWSEEYVEKAYDMTLVDGYNESDLLLFKPDNNITRAEFAKMLCRYLNIDTSLHTTYGTEFADSDEIPEWASEYVMALSTLGYMNGKANGTGGINFEANSIITRAEAMHVFSKLVQDGEGDIIFADEEKIPEWARESIRKVVSAGIIEGFDDGTIRAESPVTRAQMCVIFSRMWDKR